MNVLQGCTCCGDCDVYDDDYVRALLNVGGPITYSGNTGAFTLVSNTLTCSTADRYIVASGMPSFPNGQFFIASTLVTTSAAIDVIVNWQDTNNYDFVRVENGQYIKLYERIGGTSTLVATHYLYTHNLVGYVAIYRYGTHFATLATSSSASDMAYLIYTGMAAFTTGTTVGVRCQSGTLEIVGTELDHNGGACPEFDPRCIACDFEDTEVATVSVEISGCTGDTAIFNGTYTLDYLGTREGSGAGLRECVWKYTSGGISVVVYISRDPSLGGSSIVAIADQTSPSLFTAYEEIYTSSDFYPCTNDTYSPGWTNGDSGSSGSTCTVEIIP